MDSVIRVLIKTTHKRVSHARKLVLDCQQRMAGLLGSLRQSSAASRDAFSELSAPLRHAGAPVQRLRVQDVPSFSGR
jgi:hypothetical protein